MNMREGIRELKKRRQESLRSQKSIVKSKNCAFTCTIRPGCLRAGKEVESAMKSTRNASSLSKTLSEGTDKYAKKLLELQNYNKRNRVESKARTVKEEWYKEQDQLVSLAQSVMVEVCNLLQTMIVFDPADKEMIEIVEMQRVMDESIVQRWEVDVRGQLGRIKDLVIESQKLMKVRSREDMKEEKLLNDETLRKKSSLPNYVEDSMVADVLMQVRTETSRYWTSLQEEEYALVAELSSERLSISRMLKNERRGIQDSHMAINLSEQKDDDCVILLAIEEWYDKISTMDESHHKALNIIDEERDQITKHYHDEVRKREASAVSLEVGINRANDLSDDELTISERVESIPESLQADCGDRLEMDGRINGSSGVWSQDDHMIFVTVCRRSHYLGKSRESFLERLKVLLPHKSRNDLLRHEVWYRQYRALAERKKLSASEYESGRAKMVDDARRAIANLRTLRAQMREGEVLRRLHDEQRRLVHERLLSLREERRIETEKRIVEEAQGKKDRDEGDRMMKQRWLVEQERKKRLVLEFQKLRAKEIAQHKKVEEDFMAKRREEIKMLIKSNRGNVESREVARLEKEKQKQQKMQEKEQEDAQRLEILAHLATTVPYWDAIVNATSQLEHVTAAVKAQEWQHPEELSRGFMSLNGFGDRKIIQDARFRLAEALREAGIAQSKVAASVVKEFHPRPHLSIHGIFRGSGI